MDERERGPSAVRGVGRQDNGHVCAPTSSLDGVHTIILPVDGIWSTRSIPPRCAGRYIRDEGIRAPIRRSAIATTQGIFLRSHRAPSMSPARRGSLFYFVFVALVVFLRYDHVLVELRLPGTFPFELCQGN